ncbi:MAG: pantoate--beta-alanine ligase [Vicinamibacteria bacterium]|nr:pantoate--beta-alanine ligase [Vicinamibacteria bacterium]
MRSVSRIDEAREWRARLSGSVGFVPTMGFLHEGHLSLVRRARKENEAVAASIFVNPTQFGPSEDFARYPRDPERDTRLLSEAGCDLLFAPEVEQMYPEGHETFVEMGATAAPLEGARRPGHFRGVATVVLKLFNVIRPTRAYFGRKDAQQLAVIRRMIRDLHHPAVIVACPTVREADGLAMSSRNTYLSPEERRAATVLHRALSAARDRWTNGERDAAELRRVMRETLDSEPLARIDYVSVADPDTMRETDVAASGALISLAVKIGDTHLIDNERME